ncbi:DNA primase [Marinomonas gallaica]|uniref:DNA primase n=1 Tax=Marinomonas gallaica TaxID=1806667 RepID=UPI003CE541EB
MSGRIPDQFIDELLARTDITDVVASRITLRKTGQNFSALCPFHNEKSPSFSLNPNKQFYYCFGCGAGGNAISFVMEHDHLDFVDAIEVLAKDAGLEVPRDQGAPDRYEQNAELLKRLSESATFFQEQLVKHPTKEKARDYLAKERGLTGQIAKVYGIGYAPPGWDNLLKSIGNHRAEHEEQLLHGGMLIEKKEQAGHYYDRFRDRIMFPIRDNRGRVIAFGGRAFGDEKPKYLNSPETPVFHKNQELYGLYEAKQNTQVLDHIIVVEGYMDVIVLAQYGITNAVATLGTSVNSQHFRKLFKLVDKVTLCFDGDKAGRSAAIRGLEATLPVIQDGKQVRFLFLPEGEDPDSLVRKEGSDGFLTLLEDSSSLAHVLFEHARSLVTLADEEGEAQFTQNAMALIQSIPAESTLRSLLVKQLSEQSGLSSDTLTANAPIPRHQEYSPQTSDAHPPTSSGQYDPYGYDDGYAPMDYPEGDYTPYPDEAPIPHHSPKGVTGSKPFKGGGQSKQGKWQGKGKWQNNSDREQFAPMSQQPRLGRIAHATLCILMHPAIAHEIEVPDPLLTGDTPERQAFSRVWRYFAKHPNNNAGHFLYQERNQDLLNTVYALLNHPDATTKQQLTNAKQEVLDMVAEQSDALGLNSSIQRLKSRGNDAINNPEAQQELRALMEQLRKKKSKF